MIEFNVKDRVLVRPSGQRGVVKKILADANNNIRYIVQTYWPVTNKEYIGSYTKKQLMRLENE